MADHCWHEYTPAHITNGVGVWASGVRCCHCGVVGERLHVRVPQAGHGPHADGYLTPMPVHEAVDTWVGKTRGEPLDVVCRGARQEA